MYLVSVLVRWPLVGVILGFVLGEGTHWRQAPARMRAYVVATWLWVGLFGVRLAVQVPLYVADRPALLGVANVGLGLPLFALVIWARGSSCAGCRSRSQRGRSRACTCRTSGSCTRTARQRRTTRSAARRRSPAVTFDRGSAAPRAEQPRARLRRDRG